MDPAPPPHQPYRAGRRPTASGSSLGPGSTGTRRLADLADSASSADEIHEALAHELLGLPGVLQVHVQRLSALADPGFAVAYTRSAGLRGRTYACSLADSAGARAALSGGAPLMASDHASLPAELASCLLPGVPVALLPMGSARVVRGLVFVVWKGAHAISDPVPLAAETLVAVAGAALSSVDARLASETDPRTGCMNTAGLAVRLAEEIERGRRQGTPLTVLALELDDLAAIALQYGSPMRERALVLVGSVLRSELRRFDRVALVHDDQFVILLAGTGRPTGEIVARRAMSRVNAIKLEVQGTRRPLRVAVGLAQWRAPQTAREMLGEARNALARARGGTTIRGVGPTPSAPRAEG